MINALIVTNAILGGMLGAFWVWLLLIHWRLTEIRDELRRR